MSRLCFCSPTPRHSTSTDLASDAGWHIDASFAGADSDPNDFMSWRANVTSRGRALLMLFLFLWIRPTFPRLREDQLQKFAWKILIPITLALILVAGAWVLYAPEALK